MDVSSNANTSEAYDSFLSKFKSDTHMTSTLRRGRGRVGNIEMLSDVGGGRGGGGKRVFRMPNLYFFITEN